VTISFDVYNTANQANYAPNGMHSIDYVPPPPGGLWVSPANNATVGDDLTISAQAYPTNAGDPAIWYVNFTGWYNGKWNVMCSDFAPSYSNVYTCHWHLAGLIQPGWVTISFDVYDVAGHVNYAPNGTHNIDYVPPLPGGMWVAPANGAQVGDGAVLKASAYPANVGDPAVDHVHFTAYYNGAWHILCSVHAPTYGNVYECGWMLKGLINPGAVTISFDVYDVAGRYKYAPNGWHSINFVPGTSKSTTAIAWAMTELGNQGWNGRCEVFVENAYGTQYKFLTAQKAADNLHPTTATTPPVGALVFFKYFNPTDNAWDGHVGIYIGNNQFISATNSGVQIKDLTAWSSVYPYEGWAAAPSTWPGK
jgi:hypothetical protein